MKIFKKIEISLSRFIIGLLTFKGDQTLVEEKSNIFNESNTQKILFLRQDRIGDLLISTPVLRILKKKFPQVKMDILLGEHNYNAKDIAEPFVDSIYFYKKNIFAIFILLYKLKKQNYDIIIDLFDEPSTTSSLLIKMVDPKYSVGLKKEKCFVYSHLVKLLRQDRYHIVIRTSMLMLPFNISPFEEDLSLSYEISDIEITQAENLLGVNKKNMIVGINLSGSDKLRFWGVENNIEFINLLKQKYNNINIVVIGTKAYEAELNKIKLATDVIVAPFVNSVREYASILRVCNFIITPDTAAVHFASAFKIPTIPLFSSKTNGWKFAWLPFNNKYEPLFSDTGFIKDIQPKNVYIAFVKLHNQTKESNELKF
ncbi:hypothetical protein MNBD_IGNAVI01-451 [hydrothermal vent metagenome]|uniref:ADP-heptose--lipooligosaccharide heptosyltransferase II n=1 Tax=hydrothermal vent metagenome TaxID=652676 RepID=A0A3B1CFW9_9ZZZZ